MVPVYRTKPVSYSKDHVCLLNVFKTSNFIYADIKQKLIYIWHKNVNKSDWQGSLIMYQGRIIFPKFKE